MIKLEFFFLTRLILTLENNSVYISKIAHVSNQLQN